MDKKPDDLIIELKGKGTLVKIGGYSPLYMNGKEDTMGKHTVATRPHTEPEYLELLRMKPGEELDAKVNKVIYDGICHASFSTDITAAYHLLEKIGYIELHTDEGIRWVSIRFLRGSGWGRQIQGYMTIPEAICKAAIASRIFPVEKIEE